MPEVKLLKIITKKLHRQKSINHNEKKIDPKNKNKFKFSLFGFKKFTLLIIIFPVSQFFYYTSS